MALRMMYFLDVWVNIIELSDFSVSPDGHADDYNGINDQRPEVMAYVGECGTLQQHHPHDPD